MQGHHTAKLLIWNITQEGDAPRVRFTIREEQATNGEPIETPHDVEARDRNKGGRAWIGYTVHMSESCDAEQVNLITYVYTTPVNVAEAKCTAAIRTQGLPEKITIDQSGSNTAAISHYNKTHKTAIVIRHSKYLNNLVEQDHRTVKRITRPMLGFKSFWTA